MVSQLVQFAGMALVPAIIGFLLGIYYPATRQDTEPAPAVGRFKCFFQTWGITLLALLCFTPLLQAIGAPEHYVSGFGGIVLPAACATYFARYRLARAGKA